MIQKTREGYEVVSKEGKRLTKPNLTLAEAQKRLHEIEYFKHRKDDARRLELRGRVALCRRLLS